MVARPNEIAWQAAKLVNHYSNNERHHNENTEREPMKKWPYALQCETHFSAQPILCGFNSYSSISRFANCSRWLN
jgi:hypothetical protein